MVKINESVSETGTYSDYQDMNKSNGLDCICKAQLTLKTSVQSMKMLLYKLRNYK